MTSPAQSKTDKLRQMLQTGLLAPGCYDALTAALVAEAGFEAAYVTGGSIAYSKLGRPDIGLVSANEVADTIALIADRVELPLIVDADTGFGNAINVWRTVRSFERAGATAIQLEDQQSPKRCGHLSGKTLISPQEMVGKIKAAVDTREEALIVARTDAIAVEGLDRALDRAEAYVEAGADILFIEALPSQKAMRDACAQFGSRVPMIANMVEGGTTPVMDSASLFDLGFRLVIFPGAMARTLVFSGREMLAALKRDGTTESYWDRMVDITGINEVVGAKDLLEMGQQYSEDIAEFGITKGDSE